MNNEEINKGKQIKTNLFALWLEDKDIWEGDWGLVNRLNDILEGGLSGLKCSYNNPLQATHFNEISSSLSLQKDISSGNVELHQQISPLFLQRQSNSDIQKLNY